MLALLLHLLLLLVILVLLLLLVLLVLLLLLLSLRTRARWQDKASRLSPARGRRERTLDQNNNKLSFSN